MRLVLSLVLLAFGLGCLNYTQAFGHDHHVESAAEHGFPAPAPWMFYLGATSAVLGAYVFGYRRGARRHEA